MWRRQMLWGAWIVSFGLAVACATFFLQGILRDSRAADPVIRIDFSAASQSTKAPFRIWGEQEFDLLISSVNHDRSLVGRLLNAEFEIEVADPNGKPVLHRRYSPGATGHQVRYDYADVGLATLQLEGSPLHPWSLRVKVLKPDPAFTAVQTDVKLYRKQHEPGMGGLMNYAIMIPGAILLLGALVFSVPLARGGSRFPLLATLSVGALAWLIPAMM